jgi:predicted TIM-barrel enzyme
MTGSAPELEKVKEARKLATRPILVGSGATLENIAEFLKYADGAIVGTYFKAGGIAENPVDLDRVKRFMDVVRKVRGGP